MTIDNYQREGSPGSWQRDWRPLALPDTRRRGCSPRTLPRRGAALTREVGGLTQLPLWWVWLGWPPHPPPGFPGCSPDPCGSGWALLDPMAQAGLHRWARGNVGKETALGEAKEEPLLGVKA